MKPVYLEFCGINSFSEKAEIDFRKLLGTGLFGIFGDTGSGKSTILDCIHFALYGKIERSSGTDSINYKCDKAYVVFEFEITVNGERHVYQVRRERRRKNNVAKAFLYDCGGEKPQGIAEGTEEVNAKIREIVGLGFDDFKKCIALPQGEFAGLVKAAPKERLQLVSRLFDLEKYGDKLSAKIRSRYDAAENEAMLLQTKMQENAGGTDENIAAEEEKLRLSKENLKRAAEAFSQAEKRLNEEERRAEEKKEYDALCLKLARAEEKRPFFEEKQKKAEKFTAAKAVLEKNDFAENCKRQRTLAAAKAEKAGFDAAALESELKTRRTQLEESGIEKEIEELNKNLGALTGAEEDLALCREAEEKLSKCQAEYRNIKDKCPKEDFEALLSENERAQAALGADESFTEFLRRHFKSVLVSEAYGEFRLDLCGLSEKYPETREDVETLLKKYAAADGGRAFDLAAAQLEFKRIEGARKSLKAEREAIESRKNAYEDNERKKANIIEDGKHYRERFELARQKTERVKGLGTAEEVKKHIETLKAAKKRAEEKIRAAEEKLSGLKAERESGKTLSESYAAQEREALAALKDLLAENGFESADEARALAAEIGDGKRVKEECDEFFEAYAVLKKRRSEIPDGKFDGFSEEALFALRTEKRTLEAEKESLLGKVAVGEREVNRLKELKEKYKGLEKELKAKEKERELWDKLRLLTARGKFMEFIASEYLQEICVSASKTLLSLTNGRYFLKYEDEFKAGDNLNGGMLRAVRTLSGGETFLVSLSLALALSGAICAKSLRPIEFFFLDEGFGTLDEKLVDTVMDVLEKLRSKHFSIGLISHVEELKHRIDNKILVSGATDRCGSSLRIEAY